MQALCKKATVHRYKHPESAQAVNRNNGFQLQTENTDMAAKQKRADEQGSQPGARLCLLTCAALLAGPATCATLQPAEQAISAAISWQNIMTTCTCS